MDNITHSLVGAAAAELTLTLPAVKDRKELRPWLQFVSIAANNFPDLDFVYAAITEGKLGYLLHHRGHTHTLVAAMPAMLVILGVVWTLTKLRKVTLSLRDWAMMGSLSFLGVWLHIYMDSLNSYGVHPFWPFHNAWFYGDTLFIIEPWLWVTLLPLLIWGAYHGGIRLAAIVIWIAGLGLVWASGYVPPLLAVPLTLFAVAFLVFTKKPGPRQVYAPVMLSIAVIAVFSGVSRHTRLAFTELYQKTFPTYSLSDVVLSPYPTNPFCWTFVAVGADRATAKYVAQKGIFSPYPAVLAKGDCPNFRMEAGRAPMRQIAETASPSIQWMGEYQWEIEKLRKVATEDCRVAAYLRFSRVPYFDAGGGRSVIGDIRFDFSGRAGFAYAEYDKDARCPKFVPPWEPPRQDLIYNFPLAKSPMQ